MARHKFLIVLLCLLSYCACDDNENLKKKLLDGFIDFYKKLPDQSNVCCGRIQQMRHSVENNTYNVEIILNVPEPGKVGSTKSVICRAEVIDLINNGVEIPVHQCEDINGLEHSNSEEDEVIVNVTYYDDSTTETPFIRKPIQLDNEIENNTALTSGEQFIAIPREEQKVNCIGCSFHVNPQAAGVSDLADIGVRQLNSLEPNIKHTLNSVIDVERQVQVVNGIRYILTLTIDYNSCNATTPDIETCLNSKVCKVTVLEKPWKKFPDGSKYRAVLANNCTEQWRFDDDGVIIPQTPNANSRENNNINPSQTEEGSDVIKPKHNVDVQAQQHTEKTLTDEDLKILEEQIIPNGQSNEHIIVASLDSEPTSEPGKEHLAKIELTSNLSPNSIPAKNFVKLESLPEDKKKAIDDMLSFFNFAGFDSVLPDEEKGRSKRSYDNDLNVLNLVEKFKKIKKKVDNAKHVYKLAQFVVDDLNENDSQVKTRVLKEVINAEEEFESHKHFVYVQSRIIIPCNKAECEEKDVITKICNAVLDYTNKKVKILNVFCHDEPKTKSLAKVFAVPFDDPVLLKLIKEVISKIESESTQGKAMIINEIFDATTQKVAGTLTKFSIILDYTNCNVTVLPALRSDCLAEEEMGSLVCDVTVHDRHQYKQGKKITYTCIDRPVDTSFSNTRSYKLSKSVNDPAVLDMANEALQYLEGSSNRNNKQVVVRVNSVVTQLVAGFLTDIEFVVGYTTCSKDDKNEACKLLEDEPLKICKAKVWDRTWIEDGRQIDVSCKEPYTEENKPKRLKRGMNTETEIPIVGGNKSADVSSPQIKSLAKDALREYLKASLYHRHYDVINILKATVQVVAGTLTKLEFKISPTSCLTDREGNPSSPSCNILDYNDVTTCSSVIWEQQWREFKQINTTCQVDDKEARVEQSGIPGGETVQDVNDPAYKKLAEDSMHKYLENSGNTVQHKLIEITKVTTQVVTGTMTRLNFRISPADQTTGDIINCYSEVWEKPWMDFREIKVNCGIDQSRVKREVMPEAYLGRKLMSIVGDETDTEIYENARVKRGGMPGGETVQDVNDPAYKKLAEDSMHKYLENSGNTVQHKLIEITKVTTQVVTGTMTRLNFRISPADETTGDIINCYSEVWEKPWMDFREIKVNCGIDQSRVKREVMPEAYLGRKLMSIVGDETDTEIYENARVKRGGMRGGETVQDVNDPAYKKLAEDSMHKYLENSGNTVQHKLIEITKVTTQVVAGKMTRLNFRISPADQTTGDIINCYSEVWEKPWMDFREIKVNCGIDQSRVKREVMPEAYLGRKLMSIVGDETDTEIYENARVKRGGMPGGETVQDVNDPAYKKLAEDSMHKYLENSGNTVEHKLIEITKVTTQVVTGTMTRLNFRISPADETTGDIINCYSEVWEKPWMDFREIKVNCGIDQSRVKREVMPEAYLGRKLMSIVGDETDTEIYENARVKRGGMPGGETVQDVNDPAYKKLAEDSMHKYLENSGNTVQHKLIEITKVTTQVVAGKMTRLNFRISPADQTTGDIINCYSEVWEKPWMDFREIKVNCGIDQSRVKREVMPEAYLGRKLMSIVGDETDTEIYENARVKRGGMLGGETVQDVNDPAYKKLAEDSMHKYLENSGNTVQHKLIEITKVTTQVVAGKMTRLNFRISPADQTTGDIINCYSEVWEKPWMDFREIKVNCGIDQSRVKREVMPEAYLGRKLMSIVGDETDTEIYENARVKRGGMPGGETVQDVNDPAYKKLAEDSMHKYLENSGNTVQHKLIEITKVTTQVVAGKMTRLNFRISPADQTTGDIINCYSEVWEKPWMDFREIKVNCGIDQSRVKREVMPEAYLGRKLMSIVGDEPDTEIYENARVKRGGMPGGETVQDVNDPAYKKLAEDSMHKYLENSGNTVQHKLIEITKVTTQVVAGKMTRLNFRISPADQTTGDIINCYSEVWEKPWMDFREIKVNCGIDQSRVKREVMPEAYLGRKLMSIVGDETDTEIYENARVKRGGMLGGETVQDVNDPAYKKLAEDSMHKYLENSGNTVQHKLIEITKVTTQVVAGKMTRLNFRISPADQTTGDIINCYSEVWEKPWMDFREIKVNCGIDQSRVKREVMPEAYLGRKLMSIVGDETDTEIYENARVKRGGMPGGETVQDVNDPAYKKLAEDSMHKYLENSGNTVQHKLIEITKVTTQVVAGKMTRLNFRISPADQTTGDIINCYSEVWEKPWMDFREIKVNCGIDQSRVKREVMPEAYLGRKLMSIVGDETDTEIYENARVKRGGMLGGETVQDVNDPAYKKLAEDSMHKYLENSGNTVQHKLIEITKVTTQVVAGKMTRLNFRISPADQTTGDIINCYSEVWEKPWMDFREIKVNCGIDQSRVKREVMPEAYLGRKLMSIVGDETDTEIYENARVKRGGMPGGETVQDVNDPAYKKLAEDSMHKYLENSGNTVQHKLIEITKVTTQVVAGKMTRLNFRISPADQTTGDIINCYSEVWEKPWMDFREIKVNCGIDQSRVKREVMPEAYLGRKLMSIVGDETDTEIYENARVKRGGMLGGETVQDVNDPAYKKLAEDSMHKYLENSGNTVQHKLIEITKVTTQVVAGKMTRLNFRISPADQTTGDIINCYSEVWEKPWMDFREIKVNCGIDQSRVKREVTPEAYLGRKLMSVVGDETEKDFNDPEFKTLAKESIQKYIRLSDKRQHYKLMSIQKATVQNLSGKKTKLEFSISPTNCQVDNDGIPTFTYCKVIDVADVISCFSEIYEQKWRNSKDINVTCYVDDYFNRDKRDTPDVLLEYDPHNPKFDRIKREIINKVKTSIKGGFQDEDPKKSEYKTLAQGTLREYLKLKNISNPHDVVEVKKVKKQVVSGIKYNIEYTAAPKSCAEDISKCVDQKLVLQCRAQVWDRSWLSIKDTDVNCWPINNKRRKSRVLELIDIEEAIVEKQHREKRQIDDYVDEDMSFYYADRAMKYLNNKLNSNNLHKLVSIHGTQNSLHMNQPLVRMYIETVETYCLRHRDENILPDCEELDGMTHLLCLVKLWPSPDNELVVEQISMVCDDDEKFETVTGISVPTLIKAAINELERSQSIRYRLVHQGEPQVLPSLDSNFPLLVNFIVASTNCSKFDTNLIDCFTDISRPSKSCTARIWLKPNSKTITKINAQCYKNQSRKRRSISLNPSNATADEVIIQSMVQESIHKLEMSSANRYKQRVAQINSYSTKITSGKVTTIDFDVGYTSCLKFEWVEDVKTCEFLGHLPRRHCVSQVWERLWLENGRNIEVTCEEDETPLESHMEFESSDTVMQLANESLKYIDAKYPQARKQKVVRIFSLEKQVVAGVHYRMKIEIGPTKCAALSAETNCKLDSNAGSNMFCRINVWLRPWTDHPPNFRVTCDYQESASVELYHRLQAEALFGDFLTTYKPDYINKANELKKRFNIFMANVRKIHELNIHEKGTAYYGVTRFTDLSYEEFTKSFLGLKTSLRDTNQVPMRQADIPSLQIPEKFDWREHDAVTEVKNQGSCGSCWAFSVTGNIEGQWKMQSGQLVSLSEQELVDCDKLDQGCNGGLPDNAYRAIEQLGGLELETDYPYEGEDDTCSFNKTISKVKITGAVNITSNETDMAKWLVQNGPISIGINANAMQFYMGGVSHPWKMLCNPSNLDHGVLIVGYGVKNYPMFHKRLPYWTIKNSWGPEWGEQGYYRVFRGDGTCGVNQMASSAVI